MPVITPYKSTFTRGELSPLLHGRAELEYYRDGLETCRNWIPLRYGGLTRRPGTYFVKEAKEALKSTRLVPFVFSVNQAYMLEFGDLYFRVFAEQEPVLVGAVHVEVVTPYTEADLINLRYVQSGDILFLVHPNYAPRQVRRLSHTSWDIQIVTWLDGPYLDPNPILTRTVVRSGAGPVSYTLTWANDDGINEGAGFTAADVGRQVRIKHVGETEWSIWRITAVTSGIIVTADLEQGASNVTATPDWRLDAWNTFEGWPTRIAFYQQRLMLGRTARQPETIWGSRPYFIDDFRPGVNDDDGITFTLRGEQVSEINWMKEAAVLVMGTVSSTRTLGPSETGILSATSFTLTPESGYRTTPTPPVRVSGEVLFAGAFGRSIHELRYEQQHSGYIAPDISAISEHLLTGGILEMAYLQVPLTTLWIVTQTGELVSMTYEHEQEVLGFAPHELGGTAFIESIACIPGTFYDELWMVTVRTINGAEVRYIEVMQEPFFHTGLSEDAWFLDCASFYVGVAASTFTGLGYLEGELVDLWSEGAYLGEVQVVGGSITLPDAKTTTNLIVGLRFVSFAKTLPFHADVFGEGDVAHEPMLVNQGWVNVYRTLGLKLGNGAGELYELHGRNPQDGMDVGPSLRTGIYKVDLGDEWANGGQITIQADLPTPALIRSLKIGIEV